MTVRSSTRRLAVLEILRARSGHAISMPELQFAWLRTGLRETDLSQALHALKDEELVALEHSHRGLRLTLTRAGALEARWPSSGLLRMLLDSLLLRRLRERRREYVSSSELRKRRQDDPHAAS